MYICIYIYIFIQKNYLHRDKVDVNKTGFPAIRNTDIVGVKDKHLKDMTLEIKFWEISRESNLEPNAETNFKQFSFTLILLKFGQLLRPM
jgi:hypothetical protein